jgi:peptide/nickel transport system permease protein
MRRYMVQRLLQAAVVLFFVSLIVFFMLHALPGGAGRAILGKAATPWQVARFDRQMGYDRPIPVQYWLWVTQLLRGDLGFSYKLNEPVSTAIAQALPKTVLLASAAVVVALMVAVPLAILQAVQRNKAADYAGTALAFLLYATPTFFLGLGLSTIFGVELHMLPTEAPQTNSVAGILSDSAAMILPVATLSLGLIALFGRYLRSSILDNLGEDYVRTARAKGLPPRRILMRHVFRNSLTSVVTMLGLSVPWILSGTVIVEQVFNYPGMGLLFWNEAQYNDFPVVLAIVLLVSIATVVGNLLADIGYAVLDPRVRYHRS